MAGYGMRDGSAIVRAIGDYANYRQRQEQIEYARDQQDYENRINERRLAMDEHRQNARLSMQMDEAEYRNSERQRIADERAAGLKARENYRDVMMAELNASEQKAFAAIGGGASGQGQGVEVIDDGDDIILGVKKGEGRVDPFTKNPHDQNSPPFRIPKASVGEARQHAARSAEIAEANGATPEETAAYIRAGFTVGDDGKARPASESEFMANLKEQGLIKAISGENVVPAKKAEPKPQAQTEDEGFGGLGEIYDNTQKARKVVGDLFSQAVKWEANNVKKGATWLWLGDKGLAALNKKDELKVKPTTKVSTPEGIEDLKATRTRLEQEGGALPKPSQKTREIAAQPSVEAQTQMIYGSFKRDRERAAAVGELYVTGQISEQQMTNFMETGDMSTSSYDMLKHRVQMAGVANRSKAALLKEQQAFLKSQKDYIEAVSKANKDEVKLVADVTKYLQGEAVNIADQFAAEFGMKGQEAAGLRGRAKALATGVVGSGKFGLNNMGRQEFGAMFNEGLRAFFKHNGRDGDLSAETVLPYMTSALGKYKPAAAQTILRASSNAETPIAQVRKNYSDRLNQFMTEVEKNGGTWSDAQQELFDSDFTAGYIK